MDKQDPEVIYINNTYKDDWGEWTVEPDPRFRDTSTKYVRADLVADSQYWDGVDVPH